MTLAAGNAQGIAQWILIALGIGFGIWILLALLSLLVEHLQDMGLEGFIRQVMKATGVVALLTLIGTAMTGEVANSALAGLFFGVIALGFFLFETEET